MKRIPRSPRLTVAKTCYFKTFFFIFMNCPLIIEGLGGWPRLVQPACSP